MHIFLFLPLTDVSQVPDKPELDLHLLDKQPLHHGLLLGQAIHVPELNLVLTYLVYANKVGNENFQAKTLAWALVLPLSE